MKHYTSHIRECSLSEVDWGWGRCVVRPGWPLEQSPQLGPQAAVRLRLSAQTDLWALCGTFPHQYLQAVTPRQVTDPTRYYCRQEIELHTMLETCEGRKVGKKSRWTLEGELGFLNSSSIKGSSTNEKVLFIFVANCQWDCQLSQYFKSPLLNSYEWQIVGGPPVAIMSIVLLKWKCCKHAAVKHSCWLIEKTVQFDKQMKNQHANHTREAPYCFQSRIVLGGHALVWCTPPLSLPGWKKHNIHCKRGLFRRHSLCLVQPDSVV